MKIDFKKTKSQDTPGVIPTKFKRFVDRKKRKLNELSKESKVVAAITKALAIQGKKDSMNYYVASDTLWCPEVTVTGEKDNKSYRASGKFRIGKIGTGDNLTFGVVQFKIKFRDSEDEMGLPDLTLEEVQMNELDKATPIHG